MTTNGFPLVTLTTDFGRRDPYVAAMKGAILSVDSHIQVVDMAHDIAAQNVLEGALFLACAIPYFTEGTVHIAVVDPGVGTDRHPIALFAGGQYLVCPDNGLASLLLREYPLQEARIITNHAFMRTKVHATFHGRDVFAPAAAHLATGTPLSALGSEIDTLVMLELPEPKQESPQTIRGEIIHVDRFGNLVTNIREPLLQQMLSAMNTEWGDVAVWAGNHRLSGGIKRAYGEVTPGMLLALFGSAGYLEIAVNGGSASAALRLTCGDEVLLRTIPQKDRKTG